MTGCHSEVVRGRRGSGAGAGHPLPPPPPGSGEFRRSYAASAGTVPSRPAWKSSKACFSSAWLFITNGP